MAGNILQDVDIFKSFLNLAEMANDFGEWLAKSRAQLKATGASTEQLDALYILAKQAFSVRDIAKIGSDYSLILEGKIKNG